MPSKAENSTKHEQAMELLRSSEGKRLSQDEIAERIGCGRATVRRAMEVLRAEELAAQPGGGSEAEDVLAEILRASEAERIIEAQIADLNAERKELKEALAESRKTTRAALRSAQESYPLFEQARGQDDGGANGTNDENGRGRHLVAVG
jgi:DNA-binding GntR family transcriptional regulator